MRLNSNFLVAVATLVASSDATSVTSETKLSTAATVQTVDDSARYLKSIKTQEEDNSNDLDSEDEERMVGVKNFKPSKSYLNHPLLRKEAEVLAAAKKADEVLQKKLASDKIVSGLMKQVDNTKGATGRIKDWVDRGLKPEDVATFFKTKYPTLSRKGVEWKAQQLYAALFARQVFSLKPTVRLTL